MMNKPVLYIVKSVISSEHVNEFDDWYHRRHIPEVIQRSGCKTARRFKATQAEDKFMYMAIYEFSDMESFLNYQSSKARQELIGDFKKNLGEKAELRTSVWEQVYP
jgi:antibiotic biosynthesis monooxygenase (ABM) superfamily enzyme